MEWEDHRRNLNLSFLPFFRVGCIIPCKCLSLSSNSRRPDMLRFSLKWLHLDEESSACLGVVYIQWMRTFPSTAKVRALMGSRETLCPKSIALFHSPSSPFSAQTLLSLQIFWSQDLAPLCWWSSWHTVSPVQTIIMLSRSRCLEPVLRWKWLHLIWWNTNMLHAITSIWMLNSLIKRGLGEFITHYISLASQVDAFHTNDYGCQSWSY